MSYDFILQYTKSLANIYALQTLGYASTGITFHTKRYLINYYLKQKLDIKSSYMRKRLLFIL